jgi:hypothetical protein
LLRELLLSESQLEEALAEGGADTRDARDYDAEYYVRALRDNFASRLERALTPEDFAQVFADPAQLSLFAQEFSQRRPLLVRFAHALR